LGMAGRFSVVRVVRNLTSGEVRANCVEYRQFVEKVQRWR
jgi:hypothetical protein